MARGIDQFSEFRRHTLDVKFGDVGVPWKIEYDLSNGADEEVSMTIAFTTAP